MMKMSQTYFWISSAVMLVLFAFLGFAINRWLMKPYKPSDNWIYVTGGIILSIIISAVLWFTMVDKTMGKSMGKSMKKQMMTSPNVMDTMSDFDKLNMQSANIF